MNIESCSPSRIKTADDCDFKYYMSYILGISDQLSASPFFSRFGSSIHNVLEHYALACGELDWRQDLLDEIHKEDLRPYDSVATASKKVKEPFFVDKDCHNCPFYDGQCSIMKMDIDSFEGCPKKHHEDALKMIELAINRYDKYYKTGIRSEDNPNGLVLGVEKEFMIELGKDNWGDPIIMHGLIDLIIQQDDDTVVVIDYKTGFKTYNTDELMKDMQPRMYSVAAKDLYPDAPFVLLSFDYFRNVPVDIVFTEEQDNVTREVVKRKWNEIKGKRKIKRRPQDWYCQYLCNRKVCDVEWTKLINKSKKSEA